jgi:arginyl-tRNA--protein-N-Asp/Glu arginylyltransferase
LAQLLPVTREHKTPEMFLSMPHPCSYLPGRVATSLFVDPRAPLDSDMYASYMRLGFRRSGDLVYRPHCRDCHACIPVRVPVASFVPSRGQRRVLARNHDIKIVTRAPEYNVEHFALYLRYQRQRHPGGGMDDTDPQKYKSFVISRHVHTVFYEMRVASRLVGVAVVDHLPDGLSAVYTFFDPLEKRRGLGVFAVLWQIERARELNLPAVYLGYLIRECQKMAYKENYRPLEAYIDGRWRPLEPSGTDTPSSIPLVFQPNPRRR